MQLPGLRSLLVVMAALGATVAAPGERGIVAEAHAESTPAGSTSAGSTISESTISESTISESTISESTELPTVGSRLVAVVDVELDRAVVRAGSHVSIVGRKAREGRFMFDVALADGHVVKGVPLQQLRSSFRVA